jgi:hypothetical protein
VNVNGLAVSKAALTALGQTHHSITIRGWDSGIFHYYTNANATSGDLTRYITFIQRIKDFEIPQGVILSDRFANIHSPFYCMSPNRGR